YPLPYEFQVAAVFQSLPGANYAALDAIPTAAIQPSLGRPLAGGTRTVTIDLLPTGAAYLDQRVNQLDARLAKIFPLGGSNRIQANVDLYNVLNSSTVLNVISTYGPRWLQPTQILDGRMLKFSAQIDF